MKLIRFGKPGQEKPGFIIDNQKIIDVSAFITDYDTSFFEDDGINRLKEWAGKNSDSAPEVSDSVRLGPPVRNAGKIVCVGLKGGGWGGLCGGPGWRRVGGRARSWHRPRSPARRL
jgi:2,4-didehydro-3-deoxy-L-rhamnonate hydrolase